MTRPSVNFVVSTGRCGSTLLGNIIGSHPAVVTINELLIALEPEPLSDVVAGSELAVTLGTEHPLLTLLLRHGIEPPEIRYPIDRLETRYSRQTGLPRILGTTLPTVFRDPDRAWDRLRAEMESWESQPVYEHVRSIGGWFARETGATTIVERSGTSSRYMATLADVFADGRFVHLHREGAPTALSMHHHPLFQLDALRREALRSTGHDLFEPELDAAARRCLDRRFPGLTPWHFDARRFVSSPPIPESAFGLLWSSLMHAAYRGLQVLPSDQVLSVDYDDLMADARTVLREVARFLDLSADGSWLDSSVDRVRPSGPVPPPSGRLRQACRPGERIRGRLTTTPSG